MSALERAVALAVKAHAGQVDKAGAPYILHPLRVMLRFATDEERIVAVLHDIVEDCNLSLDDLRKQGFSPEIIAALDCLTRRPEEPYDIFISRAAQNSSARRVKLADLEDNSDLSRLSSPTGEDHARVQKYDRASRVLKNFHRLPTESDFPPGTDFMIKECDVPLAFVPLKGRFNWWGGHPRPYEGELRVDNNWRAESFAEWIAVIAQSLKD